MIRKAQDQAVETRANMRGGSGEITIRHYFKADEFAARSRLCAQLTLPPGASIGSHEHLKEDEVYLITAGSGILDDGESRQRVNTGDAVLTGRGESHAIENDGDQPLQITAVIMLYPDA